MNITEIAKQINALDENIVLIYAFNATGKTRLSVEYKDITKLTNENNHAGVYYNAYSEDLFVWENDEKNDNQNIRLNVIQSSLNQFHSHLTEDKIEEKLKMYNPKYSFAFKYIDDNVEKGIEYFKFFIDEDQETPIKISRGEERIFVWCFFLTLFEVDAWAGEQDAHFLIDDPVSSLDEHNIFVTAESIIELIDENYSKINKDLEKKIIITTHHTGLFSILSDKLTKGEKASRYNKKINKEKNEKPLVKRFILKREPSGLVLKPHNKDVFLFHLHLMQTLTEAVRNDKLFAYHFVLLRQLLENMSSFLGSGSIKFVLEKIVKEKLDEITEKINSLSHKDNYVMQSKRMNEDEENMFKRVLEDIQTKYQFKF